MTHRRRALLALLLPLATLTGCALMTKADPIEPAYFSPEAVADERKPTPPAGLLLRLRRVQAADHLAQDLVVRTAPHQYVLDEARRWTEPPADYLRRALSVELFQRRGYVRAVGGDAPELEVDLGAFEDSRVPSAARVQVTFRLIQGDRALLERTIAIAVPVAGETAAEERPKLLAKAMGQALLRAVERIGADVTTALAAIKNQTKPS